MKARRVLGSTLVVLLFFASLGSAQAELAAATAVIGSGTAASCQSDAAANAFDAAVAAGGIINFNCGSAPVIINVNTNVVDKTVTIDGRGQITLSGEDLRQLFLVQDGGNLTLNNLSLTDGRASTGGAIWIAAQGRVTINNSFLISHVAEAGGDGGAIYTSGSLTINDTTLGANEAQTAGGNGGAIFINGGTVVIRRSYLINNQAQNGGALRLVAGTLTFEQSAVRSNIARNNGGGFYLNTNTGEIINSTFSGNKANQGGGIYKIGSTPITNVTFNENRADQGGAIYSQSGLTTLKNTILAGSLEQNSDSPSLNCDGASMLSGGRNIISDNSCVANPSVSGDLFGTNPLLGVWQGSPTRGYIPAANSPAIGRGVGCPAVDQRGYPRPLGPACEVGSMERGTLTFLPLVKR